MLSRNCSLFSLNWVIRSSAPSEASELKIQAQLRVLRHAGLDEEDAALRVHPDGQDVQRGVEDPARHLPRVVRDRDRVVVDDGEVALHLSCRRTQFRMAPDVVADVERPRRLDAAEDTRWHVLLASQGRCAVTRFRTVESLYSMTLRRA